MTTEVFQLAEGVTLSALDTGNRKTSFLAQLPANRQLQLSEKLYHLLSCLATPLTLPALAEAYLTRTGEALSETQLSQLLTERLLPYQLLRQDASQTEAIAPTTRPEASRSILSIHLRRDVLPAKVIEPIARRLTFLFNLPLGVLLLISVTLAHIMAYLALGIPPLLPLDVAALPLAYGLFILSVLVHEFGHLSACQRWGAKHGALGVGLYFVSPVFYVDVSAAWRLPRWQRLIVDSGGMYFQLLFTIPLLLFYGLSHQPLFLWVIVFIDVAIAFNLNPIAKYDGYWMLSDLLGVPNLHRRASETMRYLVARVLWCVHLRDDQPARSFFMQPFSRTIYVVVAAYGLLLFVALGIFVTFFLPALLQFAVTVPDLISRDVSELGRSLQTADLSSVVSRLADIVWNGFLLLSIGILLVRPARSVAQFIQWSRNYLMTERIKPRVFIFGNVTGFIAGLAFTGIMLLLFRPNLSVPPPTWLQVGETAPDFTTIALNGETRHLSEYKGRTVVLKFWSPACVHCRAEAPTVERAYEALRNNVTFLTVAAGTKAEIEAFVKDNKLAYPVLLDEEQTILASYRVPGFPFTYVISPEGKISKTAFGSQRDGDLERDVQAVQAEFCSTTNKSVCDAVPLTR